MTTIMRTLGLALLAVASVALTACEVGSVTTGNWGGRSPEASVASQAGPAHATTPPGAALATHGDWGSRSPASALATAATAPAPAVGVQPAGFPAVTSGLPVCCCHAAGVACAPGAGVCPPGSNCCPCCRH